MNIKEKRIKTLPNSTIITSSFKCVYLFWVGEHSARTQWKQPNISLFECYLCLTPFLFCLLFWLCRGIGCINGGDFMLLCHPQCKRKTIDSAPTLFSSDYSHTHKHMDIYSMNEGMSVRARERGVCESRLCLCPF